MTARELLAWLDGVRPVKGGWQARCPAHDDRNPSLSISERNGKILLCCHAGCSVESILEALGLTMSDLFVGGRASGNGQHRLTVSELAAAKQLTVEFLRKFGLRDTSDGVVIPYYLADGSLAHRHRVRSHLEHVSGWCWWQGTKDDPIVPYGLNRLHDARKAGYIVVVEGESDLWTLCYHGFPVLGIPGADMVKVLSSEHLRGIARAYVVQESDGGGANFLTGMNRRLHDIGWSGETRLVSLAPLKDVNELHCAGPAKFKAAFQAALDSPQKLATAANMKGFTLTTLGELLAKPDAPVDYVVEGLLVAGTVSGLFAKPKVGKGTLARNLFLAVSRGEDFLGLKTKQGRCIYLALEEREEDIKRDFRAMGADGTEPILVHAAAAPVDGIRALCDLVRERRPRLVGIDPIIRLARIKDEKAYAETYAELGPLIDVARETGSHVMFLHHSPKSPKLDAIDSPLGTTALGGIPATVISLKRTEKYRTIQTVQRTGEVMPETVLDFDPKTKRLSLGGTREQAETETVSRQILEFLQGVVELKTEPEITAAVEGKTAFVRKALRQLLERAKLSREGGGKRGDPFRYRLFSRSQDIAGTREQELEKQADDGKNTEGNLVPIREQKSFPVPEKDPREGTAVEGKKTEEKQEPPEISSDWEFL